LKQISVSMAIQFKWIFVFQNSSRDWKTFYEKIRKYYFVLPMSYVISVGVLIISKVVPIVVRPLASDRAQLVRPVSVVSPTE